MPRRKLQIAFCVVAVYVAGHAPAGCLSSSSPAYHRHILYYYTVYCCNLRGSIDNIIIIFLLLLSTIALFRPLTHAHAPYNDIMITCRGAHAYVFAGSIRVYIAQDVYCVRRIEKVPLYRYTRIDIGIGIESNVFFSFLFTGLVCLLVAATRRKPTHAPLSS